MKYAASDLREPAVIRLPGFTAADASTNFEEVATYGPEIPVRGLYLPMTGREKMRSEQITPERTAMFVIRGPRKWLNETYVIFVRGLCYEIHSVTDVQGRQRYLELVISEKEDQPDLTGEGEGE